MQTMRHGWLAGLVAAGIMLVGGAAQARPAPAFTLVDIDGNEHALATYQGKYVVLEWTNRDCPFVKKYYGSGTMQALQQATIAKGVIWLTICSSAPGKQGYHEAAGWQQEQAKQNSKPTALLMDADGTVGRAYGAKTTPHMYVINPAGEIIYEGAIDDRPTTKVEDLEGAKNYVTAALDAAMAGEPVEPAMTAAYGCSVKY